MSFELKNTVPWGRNLNEYIAMFNLTSHDLNKSIVSFGDGPASFNFEMTLQQKKVLSVDPIYQFSELELKNRIVETKDIVIEQAKNNVDKFVWKHIKDVEMLEQIRMNAMNMFLGDFELGKAQGRYLNHHLPNATPFNNLTFDLGLSSHFLMLYSQLGVDFHIASITEMLRVCKEIRLFPLLNLNAEPSEMLDPVVSHFEKHFIITIEKGNYEFQKNGNEMMVIKHP